jgi:hypothetical protein
MMIRKECLGLSITAKSPHNACTFNLVISDNPENFALYKVLQLDVFETDIPPAAKVEVESVEDKPKSKKKKDLDVID